MPKRLDFTLLRVTAATSAALLAAACNDGSHADQPVRVCTDAGGRRIADTGCDRRGGGGGGSHAYYLNRGSRVPEIGESVSGGSAQATAGVRYAPAGAIPRGGFGGIAEGFGAHGG